MRQDEKIKLVYLLAASHSGSTLTGMLIGAHNDIYTVGELKAAALGDVSRYRCSCLSLIKECEFWKNVSIKMKEKGFDFDVTNAKTHYLTDATPYVNRIIRPLQRAPLIEKVRDILLWCSSCWRRTYPGLQKRNTALMQSIAELQNVNILVDTSKVGMRLKYLLRIKDIEVKVIRVMRDGRGVALTYIDPAHFADAKDPGLRGGGMGGDRKDQRLSMEKAARLWLRSNEEAENVIKQVSPENLLQVKYEDLCINRTEVIQKIYKFIGVDPLAYRQDFRSTVHHIIGNGMRLDSSNEIILDERWKVELSDDELEIFDRVAGHMNKKLGYS